MATATLTSKGQMTIPKEVRARLGLKAGDRLHLVVRPDGTVVMTPTVPLASLADILPKPERAVSVEEMHAAIAGAVADKHKRR